MLFLPGDVPLVTTDELDAVLDSRMEPPMIRIVPASDLMGTNGWQLHRRVASRSRSARIAFGDTSAWPARQG